MREGVALVVMLAGCGRVGFGAEPLEVPPDAPRDPSVPSGCIGADEDRDGWPNACDTCPTVPNADQADRGETEVGGAADGVGDACDPRPTASGQDIALFLPFNAAGDVTGWQVGGTNANFVVANGRLEQRGDSDLAILWRNGLGFTDAWVETKATYLTVNTGRDWRGATIMTRFVRMATFGHGVGCGEFRANGTNSGNPFHSLMRFDTGAFNHNPEAQGSALQTGHVARYQVHRIANNDYECRVGNAGPYTENIGLSNSSGTGINFAVWGATVAFDYLVVID